MLVEPYALLNEAAGLAAAGVADALDRLTIDPRCVVITPAHRAANRLRERARGRGRPRHLRPRLRRGRGRRDRPPRPDDPRRRPGRPRPRRAPSWRPSSATRRPNWPACWPRADGPDADALRRPGWIDAAVDLYAAVAERVTIADRDRPAAGRRPGRVRGGPGRAAGRDVRLPPAHDLEHDHVRQRRPPAGRGGTRRPPGAGRRAAVVLHPPRGRAVRDRGRRPCGRACPSRTTATAGRRAGSASARSTPSPPGTPSAPPGRSTRWPSRTWTGCRHCRRSSATATTGTSALGPGSAAGVGPVPAAVRARCRPPTPPPSPTGSGRCWARPSACCRPARRRPTSGTTPGAAATLAVTAGSRFVPSCQGEPRGRPL